ncbi:hypothetical protein G7Y89_g4490 [Cudoniella acicularis]|uniref:Plastocyanin-like domain-containing protein n=1 Tax=Cudoniella acicularis TaxID=354080 RepID=A0A8H4RQS4_9HELO|nr:hypothetical protein G7Y89_g4490 [Cudoniella acicularis]
MSETAQIPEDAKQNDPAPEIGKTPRTSLIIIGSALLLDPSKYALDMNWDITAVPTTRIYNFTISEISGAPDVINGKFPTPLRRVNEGDRVLVSVTNQLANATTLHWHGLYQNGTNWKDGTSGVTQNQVDIVVSIALPTVLTADTIADSTQAFFSVTQNSRYRLRLINTGAFGKFQFSVGNHSLLVIEADPAVVLPVAVHRLPIHVAQRYSVILTTNQTSGNYWMRAQLNDHCFSGTNPALDTNIRALISYTNSTSEPTASVDWSNALDLVCKDLSLSSLVLTTVEAAPSADSLYVITVSFQIGAYALDKIYVNSTTWTPATTPTLNQAVAGLK